MKNVGGGTMFFKNGNAIEDKVCGNVSLKKSRVRQSKCNIADGRAAPVTRGNRWIQMRG